MKKSNGNGNGMNYFILSRAIFDSAIWRDDPHILKLFIYLIGKARHSNTPKKYPQVIIKRGELVTSLQQIAEDNEYVDSNKIITWSKSRVSRMIKKLIEQKYVSVASNTYGIHVKVVNYDIYQTANNYTTNSRENDNGWIKLHRQLQESQMYKSLNSKQRDTLIQCLLLANHSPNQWEWQGKIYTCEAGQFITSLEVLAKLCASDTKVQSIRTALKKLEKWGFLTNESTSTGRLITIINWNTYEPNIWLCDDCHDRRIDEGE